MPIRFRRIQIVARADDAFAVAHDYIVHADSLQQFGNGHAGCARTAEYDRAVFEFFTDEFQCVEDGTQANYCSAVLVIVENRDIGFLFELLLDFKATGCGDVFQIDAAETAGNQRHGIDDVVNIL